MTDGRYLFSEMLGVESDPTPLEVKEMRKEETKRACKVLGVKEDNLSFLDFEDGMLQKHIKKITEKILKKLEEILPTKVFYTYEKDVNPDHQVTSRIVTNSIKKLNFPVSDYQYSITRKNAFIGPIIDRVLNLFKSNMIKIDISKYLPLKETAIREYKSETTIIHPTQDAPLEKIEQFLKHQETFFTHK
jgi:LmbE family N-acetylglucosaminyl deacetylase